jgi:Coenzyme PQQ synthesis protein D (PqqD)
MVISRTVRVAPAHKVLFRELGGEAVILDLKTERYLGLDETGTRMWRLLTELDSIQAAYAALLDEYEVEPDRLRQDLVGFVEELSSHGLIEIVQAANPPDPPSE